MMLITMNGSESDGRYSHMGISRCERRMRQPGLERSFSGFLMYIISMYRGLHLTHGICTCLW